MATQQTAGETGIEARVVDPTASVGTDAQGNVVEHVGEHAEAGTSMDSGTPLVPDGGQRPAWLPPEVNTVEELDAWYRKNREAPNDGKILVDTEEDPDVEKAPEEAPKEEKVPQTDDEIRERLKATGGIYADPKYEPFALEFEKTGALSPESVTKAAKEFKVSEDIVKAFMEGQTAQRALQATQQQATLTEAQQKMATAIISVVPDGYEGMLKWATTSPTVDAETKSAYDAAMDRGDTATVKVLLKAIHEEYMMETTGGTGRRDITTRASTATQDVSQGGAQTVQPFTSRAEAEAAMGGRRYRNDSAYRAQVDARYVATKFDR